MDTPLNPTLYSKTGVSRGIPIFRILIQHIDCGYGEVVLTSTHNLCFGAKIRKKKFSAADFFFTILKLKISVWASFRNDD